MSRIASTYSAALLVTVLLSAVLSPAGLHACLSGAWLAAIGLVAVHAGLVHFINLRALRAPSQSFIVWAMAVHGGRVLVLLACVIGVYALAHNAFAVFALTVGVGYFVFLAAEIAMLLHAAPAHPSPCGNRSAA